MDEVLDRGREKVVRQTDRVREKVFESRGKKTLSSLGVGALSLPFQMMCKKKRDRRGIVFFLLSHL